MFCKYALAAYLCILFHQNGSEIPPEWSLKGAGDVAQLVEQRTENPCVVGSIPIITTSI